MPGMDAGALVGAGTGFLGGLASAGSQNQQNKDIRKRYAEQQMYASPEHLVALIQMLQPLFRELVAQGMGPAFQQMVAHNLATHGMTGTGVGESLRSGAAAMPGKMAFESALGEAGNVANRQTNVALQGPLAGPHVNPFLNALMGAAQGYMGGAGLAPGQSAVKSTGTGFPGSSQGDYANLPNASGTASNPPGWNG